MGLTRAERDLTSLDAAGNGAATPRAGAASARGAFRNALLVLAAFLPLLWLDTLTPQLAKPEGWVRDFLDPLRDYGGLFGESLILAMIFAIDERRRKLVLTSVLAVAVTFLLTQVLKFGVVRYRPEIGRGAFAFALPLFDLHDEHRSFPSGHTSSAFALSTALACLYPRGRWGFYLIAAACAVTRVLDARHFPTDVYAGAILGILTARRVMASYQSPCGEQATGS